MHIQLVQRHIHRPALNYSNGMYDNVFWEVELVDAPDCYGDLQQSDIWRDHTISTINGGRKQCNANASTALTKVMQLPDHHRADFIRAAAQVDADTGDAFFKKLWPRGIDYYINSTYTETVINHDKPGFSMVLHGDNNHIVLQSIINLTDNDSVTDLVDVTSPDPYYTMTGEKNKGIMFLNGSGTLHQVRNINKDRYTLYSAIMIS